MRRLGLLSALAWSVASGHSASAARKPHIVYMLADNLGWGGVGFLRKESPTGETPEVSTPTLDRLADDGVRLSRFYTYKMCSPSRSSLLSGRLPIHVNFHNSPQTQPGAGIPVNMTTLPQKLRDAGYQTHQIGKWHVGFASRGHIPTGRGFDTSFGYFHAYNGYLGEWATGETVCPGFPGNVEYGEGSLYKGWCTDASVRARHLSYTTDLWDTDGPAHRQNGTGFEEAMFTNRAVGIIEGHDPDGPPLFMYYAMHTLHSPLCAPPAYLEKFAFIEHEDRRFVAAMTAVMDDAVATVVAALERTGLWKDTLFIWTSDNGAAIELITGAKSAYPLRGGYYTNWEGGIRAPALVNGGFLPSSARGRVVDGYVHIADWYATLCGLAGVPSDDPRAEAAGLPPPDSLDVWPHIAGLSKDSPRQSWLLTPLSGDTDKHGGDAAYILGNYKLLVGNVSQASWCGPQHPNETVLWDTWSTVEQCTTATKKGCLFNIIDDPEERSDLASEHPGLVDEILALMRKEQAGVFDPDRGKQEADEACAAMASNGGFWGPWHRGGAPSAGSPIAAVAYAGRPEPATYPPRDGSKTWWV